MHSLSPQLAGRVDMSRLPADAVRNYAMHLSLEMIDVVAMTNLKRLPRISLRFKNLIAATSANVTPPMK